MNFRQYLISLRNLLQKKEGYHRFILGNSGADYDSVIGSLLYAFYFTTVMKVIHLPLIACSQKDLPLRFQILTVLDSLLIRSDQLLYTEMVPNLYTSQHNFALYDHNIHPEIQQQKIFSILDHHAYNPESLTCSHIINHCGSSLTLLYYLYYPESLKKFQGSDIYNKYIKYFEKYHPISFKELLNEDREDINQLIYYGIMIDSYDLSPNQTQVWNQLDKYAIEKLKERIIPKFSFNGLANEKFNTQKNIKLTFNQQQRKDYKQIRYNNFVFHYSTILIPIDLFIQRYWKQMQQQLPMSQIKSHEVYAFMFAFPLSEKDLQDGKFQKYILFSSNNLKLVQKLQEIMEGLKFIKYPDVGGWRKWTDPEGKISRKIFDKEVRSKL